jgi:hypothetical protein
MTILYFCSRNGVVVCGLFDDVLRKSDYIYLYIYCLFNDADSISA